MPSEDTQFKPGCGGRRKGSRNRRTKQAEAWAQSFLTEPETQAAIQSVAHNPGHPDWKWVMELIHNYAYGKPVKRSETKSDIDQRQVMQIVDYREFFAQVDTNGSVPTNGHVEDV